MFRSECLWIIEEILYAILAAGIERKEWKVLNYQRRNRFQVDLPIYRLASRLSNSTDLNLCWDRDDETFYIRENERTRETKYDSCKIVLVVYGKREAYVRMHSCTCKSRTYENAYIFRTSCLSLHALGISLFLFSFGLFIYTQPLWSLYERTENRWRYFSFANGATRPPWVLRLESQCTLSISPFLSTWKFYIDAHRGVGIGRPLEKVVVRILRLLFVTFNVGM